MPAGASTDVPVTKFPSIKAVGAKRRSMWTGSGGFFMQMHVDDVRAKWKQETPGHFIGWNRVALRRFVTAI
jgi:hypothetical protein